MIGKKLKEKYKNVDLEALYEEKFNDSAPYYDMAADHKTKEEWKEIMIKAIEEGKPYEVQETYDPDTLY